MSAHLLALTVGPVQEFISAARRTRDLWFGSYLLSEISKATANAVRDQGGQLIFPAPCGDDGLKPDSPLNVANVIVAELRHSDPAAVAKAAKDAAHSRWRSFAAQVHASHQAVISSDIWNDQVDDVIEFYAAWVEHSPERYQADRARLMRLLAGRKLCRDFLPAKGRPGIPKSSLDGLRESVLRPSQNSPERSRRRLRLQEGEELDVVGLVKRTWAPPGTGNPRYPSVARVAADPWLRGVGPEKLQSLREACETLGNDVLHTLDTSDEHGHPHYDDFPFEGTAVFRSRHRDLQQEAELTDAELIPLIRALSPLTRDFDEPSPYLAVLVADGDRMGRALSQLGSAESHRDFSQRLATFAGRAREVVHQNRGVLVYAGGDDVLAFVPVDQCITCARELHDCFRSVLQDAGDADLTLSVGVAVAHFMEPLEDLLDYGRAAERHAKWPRPEDGEQKDRNALAVHVIKRGGDPVAVRSNWADKLDQHLQTLAAWIAARAISSRVAYDLRTIASVYDVWPADSVAGAIQRDTLSTLKGKQPAGKSKIHEVEHFIRTRVTGADSLRRLGDELLVARQVALALSQAQTTAATAENFA